MRCSRQSGPGCSPSRYWKTNAPRIAAAPTIAMTIAAPAAPGGLRIMALARMGHLRVPARHNAALARCRFQERRAPGPQGQSPCYLAEVVVGAFDFAFDHAFGF